LPSLKIALKNDFSKTTKISFSVITTNTSNQNTTCPNLSGLQDRKSPVLNQGLPKRESVTKQKEVKNLLPLFKSNIKTFHRTDETEKNNHFTHQIIGTNKWINLHY
jgi:hypothetical protein